MNKKCMYGVLLLQSIIFSIRSSDDYILNYNNVKDEHKVQIEAGIRSICAINCTVFPHQSIEASVNPLLGGKSGDGLYTVETPSYKYVFRCMKQPHSIEKCQSECMYSDLAAQKDLGPKVLYKNVQVGCYMTEFIEGIHLSSSCLEDRVVLEQLADCLRKLHGAAIDSCMRFDIFERMLQKLESSTQNNPEFSVELMHCLNSLKQIQAAVAKHAIKLKTCHNDIHSMNLLYTPENTIQFIDWGNAGLGDPFWDLACSSIKLHFSKEQRNVFLEKYFENNVSPLDQAHFNLMENVVVWEVWLYYLSMKQAVAPQPAKNAVFNYFRKIGHDVTRPINTFEDLAAICFDFIQKRAQSLEYKQDLMLLEQLG